jgi:hypothetical protein
MRTTIKVTDLSQAQWSWLNDALKVEHVMQPDTVRVCTVFQLGNGLEARHVELPVFMFSSLMHVMESLDINAEASRWTGTAPECQHGPFFDCDTCTRALPHRCPHQHVGGICTWCGHATHKPHHGVPESAVTWATNETHAEAIRQRYPDANIKIMPACGHHGIDVQPGCPTECDPNRPNAEGAHKADYGVVRCTCIPVPDPLSGKPLHAYMCDTVPPSWANKADQ